MRRREFLVIVSTAAVGCPLTARAQQLGKTFRLSILTRPGQGTDLSETVGLRYWRAWWAELQRLGYFEGKNLIVHRHEAQSGVQSPGDLFRHITAFKPDVIFTPAQNIALALKSVGTSIPIVTLSIDPVESGLVDSLARPGGNITGIALSASTELAAKRYELLKEVVPFMSKIAVLILREYWEARFKNVHRDASRHIGIAVIGAPFDAPADEREFQRVFTGIVRDKADSLYLTAQPELLVHRRLIAAFAAEAKLPTISVYREHAEAGGLMAYSVNLDEIFRRAAGYIDRIFKGTNPAEIPIHQPTEFDLVVNLRTARALDLTVPASILARADEVIE